MPMIERPCPVCTQADAVPVFDNAMAAVGGLDMGYCIGRCQHCGFHFAHRLPEAAQYGRYYQSLSKYDVPATTSVLDQARIDATVLFCQAHIARDAVIADLGCGDGALLGGFKAAGWQALQGLDPAPLSAQCALERYGVGGIHRASMAEADRVLDLSRVDLVCSMAVLEHLPNLRSDLQALLHKLRPGCKVLVEVPAVECFTALGNEPHGELSLEHIQFFSRQSLCNLFASLGARTLAVQTLALPMVGSGSLLGLFEWPGAALQGASATASASSAPLAVSLQPESGDAFARYVQESNAQWALALAKIPTGPLIVYGAGSHTARLLPALEQISGCAVQAVVDSNPNLLGKTMGRWTIQSPDGIGQSPTVPVLVSSFRSQAAIAQALRARVPNPLVLLY